MKIEFPATHPGIPSFVTLDDFLDRAFATCISEELSSDVVKELMEPFLIDNPRANFSNNLPFIPDGKGIPDPDRPYEEDSASRTFNNILEACPNLYKLWLKMRAEEFFNRCIPANLDVFRHKGIVSTNLTFNADAQLSNEKKQFVNERTQLTIAPDFHLSIAKHGYDVKVHSDNRYKILFGVLFFNDVPSEEGGQTCFWASRDSDDVRDYPRYPDPENIQLLSAIEPRAGRLVLGLNSNDAYHSVNEYSGRGRRQFVYFSFFVPDCENVWKVNYQL